MKRDYWNASSVQLTSLCLDELGIRHSVSRNAKTGSFVFYDEHDDQIKFNPFARESDLRAILGGDYDDTKTVRQLVIEWLQGKDTEK